MSLAPRRALACVFRLLVVASVVWARRADAQTASPLPSRRVVVLVVLPSAARLDASRLRVDIGNEFGADVVAVDDPLAPIATGTLTVGLDASGGTVTIRYEARPVPISREMQLPPASDAAERAVVLLAGNLARDESAELALAVRDRRAANVVEAADVRHAASGGERTEPRSDAPRSTVRFGVGSEPVVWYVPASSITTNVGARVFGRMNIDISPLVAFHADLGAGVLSSVGSGGGVTQGTTSFPISVRADLQLNVAQHYAVGLGVDLGVDISRTSTEQFTALDPNRPAGGTATGAEGMLGFHASPLILRFGEASQFQFAAQEGVLLLLEQGNAAFEQTISFTYLFGSPAGR